MSLLAFLSGAVAMGFAIACCFFLRFWARTREILFLAFAGAFLLMAGRETLVAVVGDQAENNSLVFLPRLAAFLLIIVAILAKNLSSRKR